MEKSIKNILFINHSVRDGGPGRSLFYILKYLNRKKAKPYILIPKDDIFSDNLKDEAIYENIIVDSRFPENIFVPRFGMEIYNNKADSLDFGTMGFDEALLLDSEGYLAEGTGENIFMVRDGKLKTPPLTSILEGFTRNCILRLAKDNNITVEQQRFTRDELYIADEVFLTGTAAEITPVREIDLRKIGTGKPGKITKKLQETYFNIIRGKNEKYAEWLDYL